jgi:outer membrane autotransporter protein
MMVSKKIDASNIELWRYYRRQPYLFAQLPQAWQLSVEANYNDAMKRLRMRQRRKAVPISIMATLAALSVGKAKSTTYTTTLTGTSADTSYSSSTDANGNLVYAFASGDSISTTGTGANVYGVDLENSSPKVILQAGVNGTGQLNFSTVRPATGSNGEVDTINVNNGANLTVNGDSTIYAQTADVWNSTAIGLHVTNATATFNGTTTVSTYTPGYSQAVSINHSFVTFNGDVSFTAQARGSMTSALYISGGGYGNVVINGNATVQGLGIWPNDNVHGIYNDNVNTRLTITGNLMLTAKSYGSTVMGIRNQGNLRIDGNAAITATGPRSAYGIDNRHRTARTYVGGDLTVSVVNTTNYTPFGNPVGVSNTYGMADFLTVGGAANISVSAATADYAITNNGVMSFTNAARTVTLRTSANCAACDVVGIQNTGGPLTFAGGLDVDETTTGTGHRYAIWNVAANGVDATVKVNQGSNQPVNIDGDVLDGDVKDATTGTLYKGSTALNLDTATSYLKGLVLGYTQSGSATLALTNGASWMPTGTGTLATDFGAGSLVVGAGSAIDMAASWGAFAPGNVPSYSLRTLQVGSTDSGGASVSLSDGAVFTLLSDVRHAQADKVVFGSGITSFTAQGTQDIRIAYDPALDDTSWVNASAMQKGVTIAAASPIVIVDASSAANGTASFLGAAGLTSQWSTTYENALVRYSYVPVVSLSADHKQIVLTGIDIVGNGSSTGSGSTSSPTPSSPGSTGASTTPGSSGAGSGSAASTGGSGSSTPSPTPTPPATSTGSEAGQNIGAVTPSTGVLVAGDAALALANAWQVDEQAISRRSESGRLSQLSGASGAWVDTDAGDFTGQSSGGRSYRQHLAHASFGAERLSEFDGGRNALGLVYTHTQSHASLQGGSADVRGDSIGVYDSWNSRHGGFADAVVRVGQLRDSYTSTDAFGSTSGHYRPFAASASARAGWRYQLDDGGYVEPQVQAAYGSIGSSSYVASDQVHVDVSHNHTFLTRAGVLIGQAFAPAASIKADMYLRASAVHAVGSRPNITASLDGGSVPLSLPSRHGTAGEVAVGVHLALAGRWSVFAEAGQVSKSSAVPGGWRASAGVRASF